MAKLAQDGGGPSPLVTARSGSGKLKILATDTEVDDKFSIYSGSSDLRMGAAQFFLDQAGVTATGPLAQSGAGFRVVDVAATPTALELPTRQQRNLQFCLEMAKAAQGIPTERLFNLGFTISMADNFQNLGDRIATERLRGVFSVKAGGREQLGESLKESPRSDYSTPNSNRIVTNQIHDKLAIYAERGIVRNGVGVAILNRTCSPPTHGEITLSQHIHEFETQIAEWLDKTGRKHRVGKFMERHDAFMNMAALRGEVASRGVTSNCVNLSYIVFFEAPNEPDTVFGEDVADMLARKTDTEDFEYVRALLNADLTQKAAQGVYATTGLGDHGIRVVCPRDKPGEMSFWEMQFVLLLELDRHVLSKKFYDPKGKEVSPLEAIRDVQFLANKGGYLVSPSMKGLRVGDKLPGFGEEVYEFIVMVKAFDSQYIGVGNPPVDNKNFTHLPRKSKAWFNIEAAIEQQLRTEILDAMKKRGIENPEEDEWYRSQDAIIRHVAHENAKAKGADLTMAEAYAIGIYRRQNDNPLRLIQEPELDEMGNPNGKWRIRRLGRSEFSGKTLDRTLGLFNGYQTPGGYYWWHCEHDLPEAKGGSPHPTEGLYDWLLMKREFHERFKGEHRRNISYRLYRDEDEMTDPFYYNFRMKDGEIGVDSVARAYYESLPPEMRKALENSVEFLIPPRQKPASNFEFWAEKQIRENHEAYVGVQDPDGVVWALVDHPGMPQIPADTSGKQYADGNRRHTSLEAVLLFMERIAVLEKTHRITHCVWNMRYGAHHAPLQKDDNFEQNWLIRAVPRDPNNPDPIIPVYKEPTGYKVLDNKLPALTEAPYKDPNDLAR